MKNVLCSQTPRFEISNSTLKSLSHNQSHSSSVSLTSTSLHSDCHQLNPNPGRLPLNYCNSCLFSLFLVSLCITSWRSDTLFPKWYSQSLRALRGHRVYRRSKQVALGGKLRVHVWQDRNYGVAPVLSEGHGCCSPPQDCCHSGVRAQSCQVIGFLTRNRSLRLPVLKYGTIFKAAVVCVNLPSGHRFAVSASQILIQMPSTIWPTLLSFPVCHPAFLLKNPTFPLSFSHPHLPTGFLSTLSPTYHSLLSCYYLKFLCRRGGMTFRSYTVMT